METHSNMFPHGPRYASHLQRQHLSPASHSAVTDFEQPAWSRAIKERVRLEISRDTDQGTAEAATASLQNDELKKHALSTQNGTMTQKTQIPFLDV